MNPHAEEAHGGNSKDDDDDDDDDGEIYLIGKRAVAQRHGGKVSRAI